MLPQDMPLSISFGFLNFLVLGHFYCIADHTGFIFCFALAEFLVEFIWPTTELGSTPWLRQWFEPFSVTLHSVIIFIQKLGNWECG